MVVTLYKMGEVSFHLIGANGFHACKSKEWRIYCCELVLSSEPQKMKVSRDLVDCVKRERASRAARFFFLIQPIKSTIYDYVVAVAVVDPLNSL